ncbi:short-chain dehydrogenase/reductase-like protein SDR [Dothidotthia symphoricarpi CBS 119687]|uniref:Short-chain dehydrogenase/reductase-like protein SDR n=1 Tax=Dothidotthia symphoricarpi CBS 119687 TaxID=1392245 RepID=A0A6A6A3M2_9PLEO|nr:short-chain dehydrogenase/reductase-like protein SDR [Dothidotthia symphoricarpi CBS 119687]KAF2125714.1 short-chain dehydrogenase/reductase-like protein SDR [Dothidotthia symphoricarpi CBS 119687]
MASVPIERTLKVLITGGARGIGRGLFRHFLVTGHDVMILDSNLEELEHVKSQAQKWPGAQKGNLHALRCDLSKRDEIRSAVDTVTKTFDGKLDVLINNAFPTAIALSHDRAMEAKDDDIEKEWDLQIAIGLTAPFVLGRLCVPLLTAGNSTAESPGCIINISSTRAYQSESNHEAYSASKAGLLGLTQSMSVSLGHRHHIRVNAIIPGWIHVVNENKAGDEQDIAWKEGLSKEDMEWHPAGRVGKASDIARAVDYLVGSEFVTGQEVVVDGGVGRKMVYPE